MCRFDEEIALNCPFSKFPKSTRKRELRASPKSRSTRVATGFEGKYTSTQVHKYTFSTVLYLKIKYYIFIYNINFIESLSKFFSVFCALS